jgi:serine/threonine-protein kinase
MARVFTITEGLENMGALKTGGQGSVYKARRMGEMLTAVKLLPTPIHTESADDKNFRSFQSEVEKLRKVNEHPNPHVVRILSSGITDSGSFPFIEMEFIEGPDLEELLKAPHDPLFSLKEVIKVAEHLSSALAHCHAVEVKHGDIKSNNVKFNLRSGNYVLLDFGLAVMSDEQRRTSLRHAGAIEFMAPEQNEGKMLFQTDVYSFGVILYELLGGRVPFPLDNRGETSRNEVMVAHMEAPVPDVLTLRKQNMPEAWSAERKEKEMQVPQWLLTTVSKCLEKTPEQRFKDGKELHDFVLERKHLDEEALESADLKALIEENYQLKKQLAQRVVEPTYSRTEPSKKRIGISKIIMALLAFGFIAYTGYYFLNRKDKPGTSKSNNTVTPKKKIPKTVIGQYKVIKPRAHFHDSPDTNTRRKGYMVPSNEIVEAIEDRDGFIYTDFTNNKGQRSKGWLRKRDLITLQEWNKRGDKVQPVSLTQEDIAIQLEDARKLINRNRMQEALSIYDYLAGLNVPEALYQYGHLGLKNKNKNIDCKESIALMEKASDRGYSPAKRTLGFLYLFAENRDILAMNNYNRCTYKKNTLRGSKLLMEAMISGDSTAKRILDEINLKPASNINTEY